MRGNMMGDLQAATGTGFLILADQRSLRFLA